MLWEKKENISGSSQCTCMRHVLIDTLETAMSYMYTQIARVEHLRQVWNYANNITEFIYIDN